MVGARGRQGDGAGQGARAAGALQEKMLFIRGLYNQEALIGGIHSCQTGNLLTGAHLASGGEIRSGISMDQVVAESLRTRQRCRAWCWGASVDRGTAQELFDDLQLAHLLELGHDADAAGDVSGAGVRSAVPRRSGQGRQERAGCRAGGCDGISQAGEPFGPAPTRRVSDVGARGRDSGSIRRARIGDLQGWRPTLANRTCRARPMACRRTSISTCG